MHLINVEVLKRLVRFKPYMIFQFFTSSSYTLRIS
nr:MAG TPA: hypothetical protein [Bacteriophage sp.]DAY73119.1 MAG TPA: hypothetical protein [Caudoviricetes sp.]